MAWKYVEDSLTKQEALEILYSAQKAKVNRQENVMAKGYPAYTTSAGWLGYSDEKVRKLVLEALDKGFSHIKVSQRRRLCSLLS